MVIVKRVSEASELAGIKALQQANLKSNLPEEEMEREGFVTAEYTPEFLERMHRSCASIIAKDGDLVVGYAIATTKAVREGHALLADLFAFIDRKSYGAGLLRDRQYIVVGQLCVAKDHRGQGLVQRMYNFFREELSGEFEYCLTDVDAKNPRSLKAHLKSGFKVLDTLVFNGGEFNLVIWDWNQKTS